MLGVGPQPLLGRRPLSGLHRVEVGGQRDLGVDHDVLAAGQPHHHVRPVRPGHRLLLEVAVRVHPRQLRDPTQLELSPPPPSLGTPQRRHEGAGLIAQSVRALTDEFHLFGQFGVCGGATGVGLPQTELDSVQGLRQRFDHALHGTTPFVQIAPGLGAHRAQTPLGQVEEAPVGLVQYLGGQGAEPVGELFLHVGGAFLRGPGVGTGLGVAPAGQGPPHRDTDRQTDEKHEYEYEAVHGDPCSLSSGPRGASRGIEGASASRTPSTSRLRGRWDPVGHARSGGGGREGGERLRGR